MKKETTNKEAFFRVLDILEQIGITYWIEGGWGVDSLIGNQTREHRDIDVDFDSQYQDKLVKLLLDIGYKIVLNELPVRAELSHAEYGFLDIHPFVILDDGSVKQCSLDGGYFEFDENWFTVSSFEGRKIPCYTEEAQRIFHSHYELRKQNKLDLDILNEMKK